MNAGNGEFRAMRRALLLFAETLMRPVIRMVLRYGLSYPEFNQMARKLYVDIAMQEAEFRIPRRKRQYKSRVACLTGLSRKEVLRLAVAGRAADETQLHSSNRAARVLDAWLKQARYRDAQGKPLVLPFRAASGQRSFSELVRDHSGDIPPRAILDELLHAGACVADNDDAIRVVSQYYVARNIDIDALTTTAFRAAALLGKADAGLETKIPLGLSERNDKRVEGVF